MPEPDISLLADGARGLAPAERAAFEAARHALLNEMSRAKMLRGQNENGYTSEDIDRMALAAVRAEPTGDLKDAMTIMALGRLMDMDPKSLFPTVMPGSDGQGAVSPETLPRYSEDPVTIRGVPLHEIWKSQREGWDGYGWTDRKIDALGRMPMPRELSRGGRQAWDARNNELLLRGLLQAPAPELPGESGLPRRDPKLRGIVHDYHAGRNPTRGHSGWLGAAQNQEYLAGKLINRYLSPGAEWLWNGFSQGDWDVSKVADQADIRGAGWKVEPVLPAGHDASTGTTVLRQALLGDKPNYDRWYRHHYGRWPSYAGSTMATFFNGMLDPSIAATGPARSIAQRLGLGIMRGTRSAATGGNIYAQMLRRYGANVAAKSAEATHWPIASAAVREGVEELPSNAALMAGFYAMSGQQVGPPQPGPSQWFSAERPDLHVPEFDESTDSLSWRPMTDEEAADEYAGTLDEASKAEKARPAVLEGIRRSSRPTAGPGTPFLGGLVAPGL